MNVKQYPKHITHNGVLYTVQTPDEEHLLRKKWAEIEGEPPPTRDADGLLLGGPTLEEFVERGYLAEHYPPQGYAAVPSPGLDARHAAEQAPAAPPVVETPPAPSPVVVESVVDPATITTVVEEKPKRKK